MKYHFILATKEFLLELEAVEEVLRERAHYYTTHKKQVDFWLLPSPQFLTPYFNHIKKLTNNVNQENLVAVISTDADFINWLKLRYQNVISGHFNSPSEKIPQPLELATKIKKV
uniref:hypothetical protein Ycf54 n=1 Tax=Chlorobotrys sp. TaxID=2859677 RepID=UPI002182312E|nr:hypothetical protein Ycf54 [Chlorobotrys sp.]UVI60837.1 hypothetical protein Ycf54 [Chlorobotrys sp.]